MTSIQCNIEHQLIRFPVGELHVRLNGDFRMRQADVTWNFHSSDDIIELLLFVDALHRAESVLSILRIPYFPFSRQDRVNLPGETLSIAVMAMLINGLDAKRVIITDPHSDVTPALIDRCDIIPQHEVFKDYFPIMFGKTVLISPDGGALKKIYKLAEITQLEVIECGKVRNVTTGAITGTRVPVENLGHACCVIVDDICDGGRTFVELAKALRASNAGKIILMVTHGFFTQGLQVFDGLIDEIYTKDGRVK